MTGAAHNNDQRMMNTERRTSRRRRRPIGMCRANSLLLCALLSAHHVRPSGAFTYRRKDLQLLSPEMICISGVQHRDGSAASSSSSSTLSVQPCPTTPEEVANFDAVVMDEHGFVRITLKDIRMRDDGRQRVHREVTDDAYYIDRGGGSRAGGGGAGILSALYSRWFGGGGSHYDHNDHRYLAEEEDLDDEGQELVPVAASDEALQCTTTPHHLQVYLVALDDYTDLVTKSQCCYELEFGPPFPSWVETEQVGGRERAVMPPECSLSSGGKSRASFGRLCASGCREMAPWPT